MFSLTMLYIGFVAIFNLCLGYALAVYLGPSPRVWAGQVIGSLPASKSRSTKPAVVEQHAEPAEPPLSPLLSPVTEDPPEQVSEDQNAVATATVTVLLTAFDNWLLEDPDRTRRLCTALVDVDQIDQIASEHGSAMVDSLLNALSGMVHSAGHEHGSITQLGKHRFLLMYPDTTPAEAVTAVEHLRQTIERTSFQHDGQEVHATVSCAVVEVLADDTRETLLERVESTLEEAQQYGRNRTFLHEGEYPTPVMPPELAIQDNMVVI